MTKKAFSVGSLIPGRETVHQSPQQVKKDDHIQLSQKSDAVQEIKGSQKGVSWKVTPIKGQSLLETALEQKQQIQYKCRKGTCGVCTVTVEEGQALLSEPNTAEEKKLGTALKDDCRLACQAAII
ncbi:ferredoxin [Bacillus ectoiniformans]|uniref:2Fe-2S iron-sulfur cluster-binding protein n=1 Tax=Bacillus ectoiniformans TaxID=1494429 RepID=UPI00195B2C0C|nr:2Fe-2S iron-sulfur cluster-binding protein [Bacillus ectoiniformans]MBM7647415.1 ferredoxin [Bacillus ectoiniformans]